MKHAAIAAALLLLSGCAILGGATPRPTPASEVLRLQSLPDSVEAAIYAPTFYRDALETVSRLQAQLDSKP